MNALVGQLKAWQRREFLFRAVWAAARLAAVVAVGLTFACFTDWYIDRDIDTPFWLRVLMTLAQIAAVVGAAAVFFRLRVPSLDDLALKAEQAVPEFGHRLVTALQLNRSGAKTGGMSPELIAEVTREAKTMAARHRLASLADSRRLVRGLGLLAPVALFGFGMFALNPKLIAALVARQALLNVDIPRPVEVVNVTPLLWPAGDEVELRFEVTGPVADDAGGVATVKPDDQPSEPFPLTLAAPSVDGKAIFTAKLPPSSSPFEVRARAAGGRTRKPTRIDFAARPVVNEVLAWVEMPAYVDPEGKRRYERYQSQGEVVAFDGSAVRIEAMVSKPVQTATCVVYERGQNDQENVAARVPMTLSEDRKTATARFDLPARPSSYRIEVADENGFANLNPPRRGITLRPDAPPRVSLLQEVLMDPADDGDPDDFSTEGMPIVPNGRVQIAYAAASELGLADAYIAYRVNGGEWTALPLAPTVADTKVVGKFRPELGAFEKSGVYGQVEYYQFPPADPATEPPGLVAGGRYNFQTAALSKPGPDGKPTKLEPGDRVEFRVGVFDRNPARRGPSTPPDVAGKPDEPSPLRLPGWSTTLEKTVKTEGEFLKWLDERDASRSKLAELEERQRKLFKTDQKRNR